MELVNNINFAEPLWFSIIPAGMAVYLVTRFLNKSPGLSLSSWLTIFSRTVYRHPVADRLADGDNGHKQDKASSQVYSFISLLLLLCLFSLALAQPYRVGQKLPEPQTHRDIVFIVDTSVSMVLRDYLVNGKRTRRMAVLKNVLTHFVDQLKGNRIQIIAYSEQAYTLVPLTTDYELIKYQLQRLEPASLTGRSSDLSLALLYALKPYKEKPYKDKHIEADSHPVFVMLTDADRPVRNIDPAIAAEYVSQHGIRLHTIAIGAGSYEAEDKEHVSLIYHPTSFVLLENIAKKGKGQFFWAKDSASLEQALVSINEAEKMATESEPEFIQIPLYHWPLFSALLYLIALYLLELFRHDILRVVHRK